MSPGVSLSSVPRRQFKQHKCFLRERSGNDLRTSAEVSKLLGPNPEVGNFRALAVPVLTVCPRARKFPSRNFPLSSSEELPGKFLGSSEAFLAIWKLPAVWPRMCTCRELADFMALAIQMWPRWSWRPIMINELVSVT